MYPDEKKFKAGYKSPYVDLRIQKVTNQIQVLLSLQTVTLLLSTPPKKKTFKTLVSENFTDHT